MAVGVNSQQEDKIIETILSGPPVLLGGPVSDVATSAVRVAEIARVVVGKMKVGGFSFGEILSVLIILGTFIAEHGDDIEAIWKAVLSLFPHKTV